LINDVAAASAFRKFGRHVLPILCLLYFVSWLDRQNVSFAKLQMIGDLGMSEQSYGLGASLFFVGYALCAIPSGFMLVRFGLSRWFALLLIGWGTATIGLMFHPSEHMFYLLRFLIGALEAGFGPGVFYFLSLWAPFGQRARFMGLFLGAGMLSNAIGAPICGSLLDLGGVAGLKGWQWLFLLTGLPAVLLGILTPFLLADSPEQARFYTEEERRAVAEVLAAERREAGSDKPGQSLLQALMDWRLVAIACVLFGNATASFGLAYWLPTVVSRFGVSATVNGFLNSLPWLCAMAALYAAPAYGRRTGRWGHATMVPLLIASAALLAIVFVESNVLRMILLCFAAAGIFAPTGILSGVPSVFLGQRSAAPALGAVNAFANMGGFTAQNAIPAVFAATGSVLAPMLLISATLVATGAGAFLITRRVVGKRIG
jgi:MFS family permease